MVKEPDVIDKFQELDAKLQLAEAKLEILKAAAEAAYSWLTSDIDVTQPAMAKLTRDTTASLLRVALDMAR